MNCNLKNLILGVKIEENKANGICNPRGRHNNLGGNPAKKSNFGNPRVWFGIK
jgi:hypothetical protein